jgi:DNA helicase II / ATP-dependent DNA helicase PcrA
LYTGKTYNSVDNIAQFFAERGMPPPSGLTHRPPPPAPPPPVGKAAVTPIAAKPAGPQLVPPRPAARPVQQSFLTDTRGPVARPTVVRKPGTFRAGAIVEHPKYGRGTILRREGDGDDAKLTISFPGYGLKKIVEKFAGIKVKE